MTSQHETQPQNNRVGALVWSHSGDWIKPVGPSRTSTIHGCLVRQEGCGWPDTTTTHKKCTARSNAVAEQVLTYGLVERTAWLLFVNVSSRMRVDCAWTVAALGPDERQEILMCALTLGLELVARAWSLQRSVDGCRMLRWSSKLRQSVPKSPPEPLVRWLVLEMLPEVDLSFKPRAPEFMATWV